MPSTNVNPLPAQSTPQPATPAAGQETPPADFTQEMRFAVVMYGGLSLAIYMNGVSQEMLRMVRSTAPSRENAGLAFRSNAQLSSTETVYRKLGQILERGSSETPDPKDVSAIAPIRTRFLVDILSGSSAGGINSVFLAKALANDEPMDELKSLWVTEGDIGVLLNDPQSVKGVGLTLQRPPRSLLNSERMYLKLLDALDGMGRKKDAQPPHDPAAAPSPNVEELDLFVTATDMEGQPVTLKLADRHVSELRHRSVFHFVYSERERDPDCENCGRAGGQKDLCQCFRNDFRADNNPFLAYASRCTSAHTAAFEPMSLASIDVVLGRHPSYRGRADFGAARKSWRRFYEEYLPPGSGMEEDGDGRKRDPRKRAAEAFAARYFNDGGTLDNYPFSHTINALPYHQASLPVDRKMFYVEPAPGHHENRPSLGREPHVFENAWMSLSTLPRYESIREDLQRVLERNHLLERVQRILKGLERDVSAGIGQGLTPLDSTQFSERTVGEMIKDEGMGPGWGGCQRLRVAETTDELALMLTRAAGFDEESDEFRALRYDLVTVWRNNNYDTYGIKGRKSDLPKDASPEFKKALKDDRFSENLFLFQFDLKWRLRRLHFVLNKLDEILLFNKRAGEILENAGEKLRIGEREVDISKFDKTHPDLKRELQRELTEIKKRVSSAQKELLQTRRELLDRGKYNALRGLIEKMKPEALGMTAPELLVGLEKLVEHSRTRPGEEYADRHKLEQVLDKILDELNGNVLRNLLDKLSAQVKGADAKEGKPAVEGILDKKRLHSGPRDQWPSDALSVIKRALLYYYEHFDRYDMISYPILYSTNVGEETDPVEVFRISPEDARNADLTSTHQQGRPKLAGTKLANFGAFFKEAFRTNDILMGRLDGAERIITAALPDLDPAELSGQPKLKVRRRQEARRRVREELISDAQRIIIAEEVGLAETARVEELLEQLPASVGKTKKQKDQFLSLTDELKDKRVQFALAAHLNKRDQLDHFKKAYEVDREFDTQALVRTMARGTKVLGQMLENVAEIQRLDKKRLRWVTRLAQVFYGLVEVAVPDSVPHLIFRHWLKLLYLFELLMVVAGIVLVNQTLNQFGLLAFGVTVTAHAAVLVLGDAMRSRRLLVNLLWGLVVAVIGVLVAVGAFTVYAAVFGGDNVWKVFSDVREWVGPGRQSGWKKVALVSAIAFFFLFSIRKDLVAAVLSLIAGRASRSGPKARATGSRKAAGGKRNQ